ncbi:MAG: tyrosine-type recombinase/integrase [Rhodospirillales bacterium]
MIAAMGRKRRSNPLGLPPRVYAKHGAFFYVHRDGRWERLGTDLAAAIAEGQRRNAGSDFGTMRWWFDAFVTHCKGRIGLDRSSRGLSQRTVDDYEAARDRLAAFFGDMTPAAVLPAHVGEYLEEGILAGRPVRANREKAALSSCFTWLMLQPAAGVTTNPCIGVRRNPESPRDRYVEDADYRAVWTRAGRSTRAMMDLIYRTLQRPEDVLRWTTANLARRDAVSIIRTRQRKTGHELEIAISAEIEAVLASVGVRAGEKVVKLRRPLIQRLDGAAYTYDGICTNLKHAQEAENRERAKVGAAPLASFGFQDLKAKGATDMYQTGVPLEEIRELCGHDSVTTTEIYVKRRMRRVIAPNAVALSNIQ